MILSMYIHMYIYTQVFIYFFNIRNSNWFACNFCNGLLWKLCMLGARENLPEAERSLGGALWSWETRGTFRNDPTKYHHPTQTHTPTHSLWNHVNNIENINHINMNTDRNCSSWCRQMAWTFAKSCLTVFHKCFGANWWVLEVSRTLEGSVMWLLISMLVRSFVESNSLLMPLLFVAACVVLL